MRELPQSLFDVYALSLPRGHGFGDRPPVSAWETDDGLGCGIIVRDFTDQSVGIITMRRRVDDVWTVKVTEHRFLSIAEAKARLDQLLHEGDPPEPMPANTAPRPALYDLGGRTASDVFNLLATKSHQHAAWLLNQLYLAFPKPDKNWASDCQTSNFHTRLWEAQLLASFREQGLLVTQPFDSPDFRIENRAGGEGWVEAVTANPSEPYNHVNAPKSVPPATREELFFGPAALRFAKTLGNKLARGYDRLTHVKGKPFMIAIADFKAPASMVWSREALIGYLYGLSAEVAQVNGRRVAVPVKATHLLGPTSFPAGLFAGDQHAELSAVMFSNACSLAKFNRVAISAGAEPEGLRYTRVGKFFDRTPGALDGIPFSLDVASAEYRNLWPHGYEPWSAELEVFHNPFARHPMPLELLPEATHWFDREGDFTCSAVYEHSVLWSQTYIQNAQDPTLQLKNLPPRSHAES